MNDFDVMFQSRLKITAELQNIMNVMHHKIGLELTSVVKVDSMIRVNHLSSPTQVSYQTTSLSREK